MIQASIFSVNANSFEALALSIFQFQVERLPIYKQYVEALGIDSHQVKTVSEIPFLPIEFFKTQNIYIGDTPPEQLFLSSGTTQSITSTHRVKDLALYEASFQKGFQYFYGDAQEYVFLALLPSYLEREGSSLVYMIQHFISHSIHPESGFFFYNYEELYHTLLSLQTQGKKVMLWGVTYALLDFVERYQVRFPGLIVLETGGMKGRRKEMVRAEVHETLCRGFGIPSVHSEYGMTELLAQGYSKGAGWFETVPWMKILLRETLDPLAILDTPNKVGGINVIDLSNVYSCSFIATQDLGRKNFTGQFEVLGRFDNTDIRGCNLMLG